MRLHNFCAGPAALPTAVLEKAKAEMLDWQGKGLSVMEMSHRSDAFIGITQQAEQNLRTLLNIPTNYQVLFLQGGASLQFSALPLNLLPSGKTADYLDTGVWSAKALKEAKRYGNIQVVASAQNNGYTCVSEQSTWQVSDDAAYFHYCPNETINGLAMHDIPQVKAPLVADMSSCILSTPIDVSQFGVIYAGAQKNIGPAGLTLVIVRDDVLAEANPACPSLMNYAQQAKHGSMINTPPTYAWYLAGLVFEWLLEQGGLLVVAKMNQQKAELLYRFIDDHTFYNNPVAKKNRSIMNVPFTLADSRLDKLFLQQSEQAGLLNLAGHRSVGGMRASIYNAVSLQAVQDLTEFMADFAAKHG